MWNYAARATPGIVKGACAVTTLCSIGAIFVSIPRGPDHGTGHLGPLRFILRLSVVDSEALAAARQIAKSRQTSNAVSTRKTAAPLSSRLPV
jgi:hypothetical protein